jgi:hypothetical protein
VCSTTPACNHVDDGDASHIQLVLKLVLNADDVNHIAQAAHEVGINPTITPLD